VEEGGDLEREAARQREYLEKTVDSLKRKLAKDSELHRTDNLRIMQVGAHGCMHAGVIWAPVSHMTLAFA
jgi:hypothetical protein